MASAVVEAEEPNIEEVVRDVKRQLAEMSALMEPLVDMMIVSELWREDGRVHIVAWVPDIVDGRPRYRRKHIVYDTARRQVVRVTDAEKEPAP